MRCGYDTGILFFQAPVRGEASGKNFLKGSETGGKHAFIKSRVFRLLYSDRHKLLEVYRYF